MPRMPLLKLNMTRQKKLLRKMIFAVTLAKKVYRSFLDLYPVELDKEWVERKELAREN